MILLIDNYDSFTYNIVQELGMLGAEVRVVKNDAIDTFTEKIGPAYEKATGHKAEFYIVDIGDGAHKLS